MTKLRLTGFGTALLAFGLVFAPADMQAQTGQLTGTVTDQLTNEPIGGVQVVLGSDETTGALSNPQGGFTVAGVPVGTHEIIFRRIGYQTVRRTGVSVSAGAPTVLNVQMQEAVLQLQGIVATGLIDPVEGARSPISVARVSREQMPVTVSGPALANLQGQIAGLQMARTSGQPGEDDLTIMLRSPTTLRGGANEPLIVVDGVVLSSASTSDISGYDIENIEVIRGAAAASLYGSQAAAGVIAITTNRGTNLAIGSTRLTVSNEIGFSEGYDADVRVDHHFYAVGADGTGVLQYLDLGTVIGAGDLTATDPGGCVDTNTPPNPIPCYGYNAERDQTFAVVDRSGREPDVPGGGVSCASGTIQPGPCIGPDDPTWYAFMDNTYPLGPFDPFKEVLTAGIYTRQSVSLTSNYEATNLAISLNRDYDQGGVRYNDGFTLNSFRVNVDHRFLDNLSLSVSSYYSRDYQDNLTGGVGFNDLIEINPDLNIAAKDANGEYLRNPDPLNEDINPLWILNSGREDERWRQRTLASGSLRWQPASWINFFTQVSYDRRDSKSRNYIPKGVQSATDSDPEATTEGSISFAQSFDERYNTEAQVQLRQTFGDLNVRTTGRLVYEFERGENTNVSGSEFFITGVPQIGATLSDNRSGSSSESESRALGYLANVALDYQGRYIVEGLFRYDGSSRFGAEERYHPYYRASVAWRMAEEEWFNVPGIDEFKLRAARGTAGGRPSFSSQYETWSVSQAGVPTKGNLGNRDLKPEHTTEHELGLEMILGGRLGVEFNYAWQRTEDQIFSQDLPGFLGFSSQTVNGGVVDGSTWELTLDGQLVQTPTFGWHSTLIADRSSGEIVEWPFPCDLSQYRYRCAGASVYGIYGRSFVNTMDEMAAYDGGRYADYLDQFMVNDDGMVVYVGPGGRYTDQNWGHTDGDGTLATDGVTELFPDIPDRLGAIKAFQWGVPFLAEDENGSGFDEQIGDATSLNLGWTNNFRWGAWNLHVGMNASIGGQGYNIGNEGAIGRLDGNEIYFAEDQTGKPDYLKKPRVYFMNGIYGGNLDVDFWVEDASYLKVRTASLTYTLSQERLASWGLGTLGIQSLRLGATATNLFMLTPWSGWDPESALNYSTLSAVGGVSYPPLRRYSFDIQATF